MNVLLLTPDRVGSTLLQRLITIYATINENYNPLTINLHELTNGLVAYEHATFKQSVLGKKEGGWGYQKTQLIANVPECLLNYNKWTQQNPTPYALPYTPEHMTQVAQLEHSAWTHGHGNRLSYSDISEQKLLGSDLKGFE